MAQTLYVAIKDDLLARIEDGTYPVGSILPTEVELAEHYGVSRPTIRQALQLLADGGYLERRKRRGTLVCAPDDAISAKDEPPEDVTPSARPGFLRRDDSRHVHTLCVRAKLEEASPEVAEALGIAAGVQVYKLVRLRTMDNDPNIFMVNYIRADAYPNLLDVDFNLQSLYARMAQVGEAVATSRRRLEMVEADRTMADLLDVPVGEALFLFRVHGETAGGKVVEYSITTYRGKDSSFEFSVDQSSVRPV